MPLKELSAWIRIKTAVSYFQDYPKNVKKLEARFSKTSPYCSKIFSKPTSNKQIFK
jgi:hypothetical protein